MGIFMKKNLLLATVISFNCIAGDVLIGNDVVLIDAVKRGECSLFISKRPIVFFKGEISAPVNTLLKLFAKRKDYNEVRQLNIDRELKISWVDGNIMTFLDRNIDSLVSRSVPMQKPLAGRTLDEVKQMSDGRLIVKCVNSDVIDFK